MSVALNRHKGVAAALIKILKETRSTPPSMRLDRLITLGVIRPAKRLGGLFSSRTKNAASRRKLPVLMYHSISDDPEPNFSPYYKICTSPRRFAEQMEWLAADGWQGVTLSDGLEWLAGKKTLTGNPVAITFDDGFRDFHTEAWPSLRQHNFAATMYLPTAYIGDTRQSFKGRECLTWAEVRELHGAGMEFGSHTVNHPKLVDLTAAQIKNELEDSKQELDQQLGVSVTAFAYPFAFPQENIPFVTELGNLLVQCGYRHCATTILGRAAWDDSFPLVRRLPANSQDDHTLLRSKLRGEYDWLARPQGMIRSWKFRYRALKTTPVPRG